jgi:hypothetical protein
MDFAESPNNAKANATKAPCDSESSHVPRIGCGTRDKVTVRYDGLGSRARTRVATQSCFSERSYYSLSRCQTTRKYLESCSCVFMADSKYSGTFSMGTSGASSNPLSESILFAAVASAPRRNGCTLQPSSRFSTGATTRNGRRGAATLTFSDTCIIHSLETDSQSPGHIEFTDYTMKTT